MRKEREKWFLWAEIDFYFFFIWKRKDDITLDNIKIIYGINVEGFTKDSSWTGTEEKRGKLLGLIESDINSRLIGL